MQHPAANPYDALFLRALAAGGRHADAACVTAEAYLDGKPSMRGKHKITQAQRDADFWSSDFLNALSAEAWHMEPLVLALTRYMRQERTANLDLLTRIAREAPDTVRQAVRYSELVLRQHSPRRAELDHLALLLPNAFGGFLKVLDLFDLAYRQRLAEVEALKASFVAEHPLVLLMYASLHAFEHLIPQEAKPLEQPTDPDLGSAAAWHATNELLIWKLKVSGDKPLALSDHDIAALVGTHLSPFLFPSPGGPGPRRDLRAAFNELLRMQIELDSFVSRSAHAFSYDDAITFEVCNGQLVIVERNPESRAAWTADGLKLKRLDSYWLYRALRAFADSEMNGVTIGSPENHQLNQWAWILALRSQLQLTEIYGIAESVQLAAGTQVDLFQALLSMELMKVFFKSDFVQPYLSHLNRLGHPHAAMGFLAKEGLARPGSHLRFPITWSNRAAKISNISGWMVTAKSPHANAKAAESVIDFWTSDWVVLAAQLCQGTAGVHPQLFERPVLKMGQHLFQLPWMVATQNVTSAALNNLRRLGSRRAESRNETARIERRLGEQFEARGFRVLVNWQPDRTNNDDPGEIDLVCAREGVVLVLEVKSTFLRDSPKEAWIHSTTTLRKAGLQLRRKLHAVESALASPGTLATALGIVRSDPTTSVRGWIVDTSIEHDHCRFSDFLKVSLEEVSIALRDERHLLDDPVGLAGPSIDAALDTTLYPEGFSSARFVEVIENGEVWAPQQGAGHCVITSRHSLRA